MPQKRTIPGKKNAQKVIEDVKIVVEKKARENYNIVADPETKFEKRRDIVCRFFRDGRHPDCVGCDQNEDKVAECASFFMSRILERPMMMWDKSFSAVLVPAEKRSLLDVQKSGLGLQCNDCYIGDRCPLKKEGSACQIDWGVDPILLNDTQKAMDYLIHMQLERIGRARIQEEMDGGVPDQNLSSEMDRLSELLAKKADMNNIRIREMREVRLPGNTGSSEMGGEISPAQESILHKIFGPKQPASLPAADNNTVDGVAIVIPDKAQQK